MLTRFRGFSSLKAWGLKIAKQRGHQRACVAVARRLAVIMHAMRGGGDGTSCRFQQPRGDGKQREGRSEAHRSGGVTRGIDARNARTRRTVVKESARAETVLMQTKGGGKHDILPVGRATATTCECLWMMPRDPDGPDMCPRIHAMPVSTKECMAHQSCVLFVDHDGDQSNPGALARTIAQVRV